MRTVHIEFFLILLGAYLSGSIMYAYFLPKYLCHIDVTKNSADGNPGVANAFIQAGPAMGLLVLALEVLKGFIPVHIAIRMWSELPSHLAFGLILAAPVAGHAFPFWNIHKGGKAIAVSFGVLLGLLPDFRPLLCLAVLYLLFSLVIVIRPHFFRSVITFSLYSVCAAFMIPEKGIVAGSTVISCIVIIKHLVKYHGERMHIGILEGKSVEKKVDNKDK